MQIGFNLPISEGFRRRAATVFGQHPGHYQRYSGFARPGVSAVDIDFDRPDPDASIAEMRRFKERVISRL